MTEDAAASIVVDACYKIHTELGPGLLESAYEAVLAYELENRGLKVHRQFPVPVTYGKLHLEEGYRADLLIENVLIVELKSVEKIQPVHKKQLLTYLRLSGKKLGLLINFSELLIKNGISRVIN